MTQVPVVDANGIPISMGYDISYGVQPHAYYQLIVTTSPQTIQSLLGFSVPAWAQLALFIPENGPIRYRCDGVAPSSAIGMPVASGQPWPIQGASSLAALQLICLSGTVTLSFELRG